MKIEPFELERQQSIWENRVRFNLSESGVHPMRVREVLDEDLGDERLGYPQTNGTIPLRERISALYPGTGPDSVLVTSGTAEANYLSTWSLVEPGDEVLVMVPNYMQVWGIARALGGDVKPLPLEPAGDRWQLDLDRLESSVTPRTKLIAICTPNNPTGAVLTESELDAIAAAAGKVGAWVISDEVYRGAELEGDISPSFHGRYERGLVHCGLSKACGLPGLRVGWICGPDEKIASLWGYKDYTTIGPSSLSDRIAQAALEPSKRRAILERTRSIIRAQLPTVLDWVADHEFLDAIPPKAGAITYVKYDLPVDSTELSERLRKEKDVLLVPGDFFAMDRYLRIGFGCEPEILEIGLARVAELLATVNMESGETARA